MRKHGRAASGGPPSLDGCERPCTGTASASRPCREIAGVSQLPAWWPEKIAGAHDPRHALQKNGGLPDQWYMDDGDITIAAKIITFLTRYRPVVLELI